MNLLSQKPIHHTFSQRAVSLWIYTAPSSGKYSARQIYALFENIHLQNKVTDLLKIILYADENDIGLDAFRERIDAYLEKRIIQITLEKNKLIPTKNTVSSILAIESPFIYSGASNSIDHEVVRLQQIIILYKGLKRKYGNIEKDNNQTSKK